MRLAQRQPDGATLREHLQAAADASGQPDPALLAPPTPAGGQCVLQAYFELSSARPSGLGGSTAIPPSEIVAWCRLTNTRLTPWEYETIAAMDRAALAVARDAARAAERLKGH